MNPLLETLFPALASAAYRVTSPATPTYNCIAWAAEDETTWWPDAFGDYYWPDEAPRTETLEAFVIAYGLRGYQPCSHAEWELGFEKIAIYATPDGIPTHAARQLSSGLWTSKLGGLEDIEHLTLESLSGDLYGKVALVLRRPVPPPNWEETETVAVSPLSSPSLETSVGLDFHALEQQMDSLESISQRWREGILQSSAWEDPSANSS